MVAIDAARASRKHIAVIVPTLSHSVEHNFVLGLRRSFAEYGHQLIAIAAGWIEHRHQHAGVASLLHNAIPFSDLDGVVIYGAGVANRAQPDAVLEITAQYPNIPIINAGNILSGVPSVIFDNRKPFREFVDHLVLKKKVKRIAFLSGPDDNYDAGERRAGFMEGLSGHGIALPEEFDWRGEFSVGSGSFAVRDFFESNLMLPEAIVCANDLSALGVINELTDRGYRVPEDTMVIGFDDLEYSKAVKVPLTTGRYPIYDMGKVAGEAMHRWIQGNAPTELIMAESTNVYRQSTGDNGDPRSQIAIQEGSERWYYSRDSNSDRLQINRAINDSDNVESALTEIASNCYDAGCRRLYLFQTDSEHKSLQHLYRMDGDTIEKMVLDHPYLTELRIEHISNEFQSDSVHWVIAPVQVEKSFFGFVLAATVADEVDFVEFIASEFAQKSEHIRLMQESERLRTQMFKSEQMASLGRLVSGLAHEINTPLGISLVATTSLKDEVAKVRREQANKTLTRTSFDEFLEICDDTQQILLSSLQRSVDLVTSFKKVSVDQHVEDIRSINLSVYIEEVLLSLRPKLKQSKALVEADLDPEIRLKTIPGVWAQLVTNLVMNAVIHGFDEGKNVGVIKLSLHKDVNNIVFTVTDSGTGIPEETVGMIFDPFYTTRRARGGTGLGLNITYNLVTQKLLGKIDVISNTDPNQGETGTTFRTTVSARGLSG